MDSFKTYHPFMHSLIMKPISQVGKEFDVPNGSIHHVLLISDGRLLGLHADEFYMCCVNNSRVHMDNLRNKCESIGV